MARARELMDRLDRRRRISDRAALQLRAVAWGWSLAALSVVVFVGVRTGVPHDPEAGDLGRELEALLGGLLVVLLVVGIVASARWLAPAAVLIVTAGALLGVYAAIQHTPVVEVVISLAFLLPGLLIWGAWQRHRPARAAVAVAALMVAVPFAGYHAAWAVYDHFSGPVHPSSPLVAAPVTTVHWVWAGATTTDGFTVKAKVAHPAREVRLLVQDTHGRRVGPEVAAGPLAAGMVATLTVDGLEPGTRYAYEVEVDDRTDPARSGTVTTFPDGPADVTIAFGSCASTGSNGAVFDTIRELEPDVFLHLGDLHYADLRDDDDSARRATLDRVLTAPAQAALYRSTTVAYVWDDHDFVGNDSDGWARGAGSALRVYREYVPHYPLALGDGGPVAQAFTIGRVRVVVTDARAGRVADPGGGGTPTMLGEAQLAWFERELLAASDRHAAVVWVNPVPWIEPERPGADAWGGFAEERRAVADLVATPGVPPVVMLSGDAHMLAVDDGSHSDYSTSGDGGFPVFHAAALDRRGSVKGGPYSHGAFPGAGQFGLVRIVDDGASIELEWSGRDWTGRTVVEHRVEIPG
jgi:hypothetical protein